MDYMGKLGLGCIFLIRELALGVSLFSYEVYSCKEKQDAEIISAGSCMSMNSAVETLLVIKLTSSFS